MSGWGSSNKFLNFFFEIAILSVSVVDTVKDKLSSIKERIKNKFRRKKCV